MRKFDLQSLVRPNIWELKPYSSARDEFWGDEGIFLDANENPFGNKNRYPDPHQRTLKKALSEIKRVPVDNICIGNGSDEIIDLVYRIFCEPQKDSVIICPPTYGMYEVSANINNVNIIKIPLDSDFELNIDEILSQNAKCLFLCSPNNPTGNSLKDVEKLLNEFNGIIVLDEAYIDFSDKQGYINRLSEFPNLIIMQTFSKAWALASARVGIAYASTDIIKLMDKTKPPYNVSKFNQEEALKALSKPYKFKERLTVILEQRDHLIKAFELLPLIQHIYPTDANFILIKVNDAVRLYNYLVSKKVIVRNRDSVVSNCIRITVGKPKENAALIEALKEYK
ncbi:MAG: histidinol-phosphate transaminase [Fermentimonas sp.]|jgi:histidinol-phosphate aminotransferase|nr:histidinol-phosphate transaminase [Fermentimonas sp.]NLC85553.1 histidinol-phosphate transaminase [Bacteroidales bacterium]HBT86865.1 histidinol-phosphate transaminase [Porphyromonadaceae bacterium]MDD3188176.1 histidinol-phosphate transaminase [Fermentimonas sp.]MDD3510376.1 histidinol-phosphate transaminase [Fermentimonas sp.]